MRSVGDSKTPVYFFAFTSLLNEVLDTFFIAYPHMSVMGVALAKVIAEVSALILCLAHTYQNVPILKLKKSEMQLDKKLLKMTLIYGVVTALQQAIMPIGKLLIQGK